MRSAAPHGRRLQVFALALLGLTVGLRAEEVVVQNDSIANQSQAYIVGDFIAGEHAGVRLSSPCDGFIVAVQVLWLEGTPGHGASVEQAIHIYDGPTFPAPGAELQLLEGPVLTPGFWNEFRYIDEAGAIPLRVPVLADQEFYVTLEFYNPTDVGHGGPSVVRDTNGCQTGRNVIYAIPGGWLNFCLFTTGDFGIRAVLECPGPTGACCYPDGTCADSVEEADCLAEFGAIWHGGLTCGQVTCPRRGACCRAGGCLDLVEPAACAAIAGVYAGDGTDCGDGVCVAGACCIPGTGECLSRFEFQCLAQGGVFLGPGTSCVPNPCPQPTGACCFGALCVAGQTLAQCSGAGGDWAGAGTTCADGNGNGVPDACEPPAGCAGDSSCDGVRDFRDIDYFVVAFSGEQAWVSYHLGQTGGPPGCDYLASNDCDGDGQVTFADIEPFVILLGQPCPP